MKARRLLVGMTLALALGVAQAAQPTSKWIVFGYTKIKKVGQFDFLDQAGIRRNSARHIEVWTKSLGQKALERILSKPETNKGADPQHDELIDTVAHRPTIYDSLQYEGVVNEKVDMGMRMNLMISEAIADKQMVQPLATALWEIDCTNNMARTLQVTLFNADGSVLSSDNGGSWTHTSPESNGSRLSALACKGP